MSYDEKVNYRVLVRGLVMLEKMLAALGLFSAMLTPFPSPPSQVLMQSGMMEEREHETYSSLFSNMSNFMYASFTTLNKEYFAFNAIYGGYECDYLQKGAFSIG